MTDGSQQPAIPIDIAGIGGGTAQGLLHIGPGGQHGGGGGGAQGLKQEGPG